MQLSIEILAVMDERSVLSPVLQLPQHVKGTNTAFYSNPRLDKLIDENMHETDQTKRLAAAKKPRRRSSSTTRVWGILWYDNWTACDAQRIWSASRSAGIRSSDTSR